MDKLHELFSALQDASVKCESNKKSTNKSKLLESSNTDCKIDSESNSKDRLNKINEARKERVKKSLSKKRKQNEGIEHLLEFQDKYRKFLEKTSLEKKVLHDQTETEDKDSMQKETDKIISRKDRLKKLSAKADKEIEEKLDKKEESRIRRILTDGVL